MHVDAGGMVRIYQRPFPCTFCVLLSFVILSQNTLIYYVDVGNESEMRIFAKLVSKVETAPKLKLPPPLAYYST